MQPHPTTNMGEVEGFMQDTVESMKAEELEKCIRSGMYKFAMRRLPSKSIKQEKASCKKEEGKEGIEEKRTGE